ncbi:uncharacterized protein LOC101211778 [Cucumis sativus]|uniref:Hepatoma-derived growth factor-related protein 2-like n=1 Tax=Cucumis sativus TaxID=3659 RepID=A0A0A0KYJ1_CUCSA|nr:uncharacterized protein LOC101211778 [Cucumis sativus]KGN53447.1 hypothetical protein Csa_014881 [Cucumis sativus]
MADFSFLSDTDDSAVEDLLSQTQDLCLLEQISAINCSSFTHSDLPSDLESRFRKLKSFPAAKSNTRSGFDSRNSRSVHSADESLGDDFAVFSPSKQSNKKEVGFSPKSQSQHLPDNSSKIGNSTSPMDNQDRNNGSSRSKSKCRYVSSPSNSSFSSGEIDEISVPKRDGKVRSKSKSESGYSASPPQSPPRKTGCFWCSPKKTSEKKNSGNKILENGLGWGKNNEFLADLNIFSAKEQEKILKKAMKEEEKINREAEKIVKWAKQASARMNISDIEDELSDDEEIKEKSMKF